MKENFQNLLSSSEEDTQTFPPMQMYQQRTYPRNMHIDQNQYMFTSQLNNETRESDLYTNKTQRNSQRSRERTDRTKSRNSQKSEKSQKSTKSNRKSQSTFKSVSPKSVLKTRGSADRSTSPKKRV